MRTKIFLLLSLFVISYSCNKEEPLKASVENEKFVNITHLKNQGTNMYQQRLFDYYDKYSVLTMYQFDTTLFNYEIISKPPYNYNDAIEANVGTLLDLIDELFYAQIGDKAILKYTPLNILLVSNLRESNKSELPVDCYFGLFCMTFTGADEKITSWDKDRKQEFKDNTVFKYCCRMYDKGLIDEPTDFLSISDYLNKIVTADNYKEYGFITFNPDKALSGIVDFYDYIRMAASIPTAELNATGGLLDPAVDKKGLIRTKYESIVAYYKKYDIDLVKIANYQIK